VKTLTIRATSSWSVLHGCVTDANSAHHPCHVLLVCVCVCARVIRAHLQVSGANQEALRWRGERFLRNVREDAVDRAWDDPARLRRLERAIHGEGFSSAGVAIRDDGGVEAGEDGANRRPRRAVVDLVLPVGGRERGVEGEGVRRARPQPVVVPSGHHRAVANERVVRPRSGVLVSEGRPHAHHHAEVGRFASRGVLRHCLQPRRCGRHAVRA